MGLVELVGQLLGGVAVMLAAATALFVGRDRLTAGLRRLPDRLRDLRWHLGLLGAVLLVNRLARHRGEELSWIVGWNVTDTIFAIEGSFVAVVQSVATPSLTAYFAFMYVYGYVFLTVFPVVAYGALSDARPIKETLVAYALNYGLGLVLYVLFISYGPRNLLPGLVEPLLYQAWPELQVLTSTVNTNTNVFPSLHTSLSVTVALLAWRTRETYPGWFWLCLPVTASVVASTVYLGIHWATDVVAGAILAAWCVHLAAQYATDR